MSPLNRFPGAETTMYLRSGSLSKMSFTRRMVMPSAMDVPPNLQTLIIADLPAL